MPEIKRRDFIGQFTALGDREVEVSLITRTLARDGDIWEPAGVDLTNYLLNPIVLFDHDAKLPVATSTNIRVVNDALVARVKFADAGVSPHIDTICALAKTGVLRAVSAGILIKQAEPLDPKRPSGGQRVTQSELMEFSFVTVPADPNALVTARAHRPSGKRQASLDPVPASDTVSIRGLYEVAQLCYLVDQLGWTKNVADWEAAIEGDGSQVPAMLGAVLVAAGKALVAMATEEVNELLENSHESQAVEDEIEPAERRARAWRKALTDADAALTPEADHLSRARDSVSEAGRCMRSLATHHADITDDHADMQSSLSSAARRCTNVRAAISDGRLADASEQLRALTDHVRDAGTNADMNADRMRALLDITSTSRSHLRKADRCMRNLDVEASSAGGDDDGTDPSPTNEPNEEGRSLSQDQRQRRARQLALTAGAGSSGV